MVVIKTGPIIIYVAGEVPFMDTRRWDIGFLSSVRVDGEENRVAGDEPFEVGHGAVVWWECRAVRRCDGEAHGVDGVGGEAHGKKGVFLPWVGEGLACGGRCCARASDVCVDGLGDDGWGGIGGATFDDFRAFAEPYSPVRGVGVAVSVAATEAAKWAWVVLLGFANAFPPLEVPYGVANNCSKGNEGFVVQPIFGLGAEDLVDGKHVNRYAASRAEPVRRGGEGDTMFLCYVTEELLLDRKLKGASNVGGGAGVEVVDEASGAGPFGGAVCSPSGGIHGEADCP